MITFASANDNVISGTCNIYANSQHTFLYIFPPVFLSISLLFRENSVPLPKEQQNSQAIPPDSIPTCPTTDITNKLRYL